MGRSLKPGVDADVIFSWAILSAVVGTAIRLLEQRLGLVGRLIGFAGGLAWAVATFLVIPVLAFENVGPLEAVKRSSSILKARFGTVARGGLRFGLLFLGFSLGALLVIFVGVVCIAKHAYVIGVPVAVLGFVLLIGISMYASAAGMYMRTILYRYATDQPIPDLGVDPREPSAPFERPGRAAPSTSRPSPLCTPVMARPRAGSAPR